MAAYEARRLAAQAMGAVRKELGGAAKVWEQAEEGLTVVGIRVAVGTVAAGAAAAVMVEAVMVMVLTAAEYLARVWMEVWPEGVAGNVACSLASLAMGEGTRAMEVGY